MDENTKWLLFNIGDFGLNPMEQGSGSNIKIFEYAAAGLVIVSTPFGVRGVNRIRRDLHSCRGKIVHALFIAPFKHARRGAWENWHACSYAR